MTTNKYINTRIFFNGMSDHPYLQLKGFLSFLILHELGKVGLCGDDLANRIGKRKGGKLTPGTIYPALKDLRKQKFIRGKKFGRKKVYTLTESGVRELERLYVLFSKYFMGLKQHIKRSPDISPNSTNKKPVIREKKARIKPLSDERSFYHG